MARWADEIRIVDIALLPEYRNRGIGRRCCAGCCEAAADGKPLRIHVERFNPALRLYERLGFRPVADRGVYCSWNGETARTASDPDHPSMSTIHRASGEIRS